MQHVVFDFLHARNVTYNLNQKGYSRIFSDQNPSVFCRSKYPLIDRHKYELTRSSAGTCTILMHAARTIMKCVELVLKTMVDAWFSDIVSATTAEQRRARCAHAAQQRANAPAINLAGLGGNDMARRRAKCLEAALMRFVSKDMPAMLPQRRGTKRKSTHGPMAREILLELTGDLFHLLVCGRGRSLKVDTREPW